MEESDIVGELLGLGNGDAGEFGLLVPGIFHLKFGMMRMEDPLIKEAVEFAAGKFFDDGNEVVCNDGAVLVPFWGSLSGTTRWA